MPFQDAILKMEAMINENLRRAADLAIKDTKAILVLLPDTKRENAYIVLGRLYQILEDYLSKTWKSRIKIHSSIAVFPEDAKTVDEILEKFTSVMRRIRNDFPEFAPDLSRAPKNFTNFLRISGFLR